jgi:hypothetical protein
MAATNVPIQESVGAALRFVRENARFVAITATLGALGLVLLTAIGQAPLLSIVTALGSGIVQAFVYAAFTGAMLFGPAAVRPRLPQDGGRVWAAMAIIAFFLFIVFFVVSIPVMLVLLTGPMAEHVADLQSAGNDQAAVLRIFTEFAEANPGAILLTFLFYAVIWFFLTSRLYIAAPATVDQQRILTFETWNWTRGATLRITGARLLLLVPANILAGALSYLVGRLTGVDTMNLAASGAAGASSQVGLLIYVFLASFISLALYTALEAGLSAYLYRGLKPADAPQTPAAQG